MTIPTRLPRAFAGIALLAGIFLTSCARNPVTGGLQLMLISESQEIQMGQEADPELVAMFGLYDDAAMQQHVADLGARMARISERPQLPWTFRVIDDPIINAFAVPGGFIYVSRGILAHFNSEAQLAAVLGHELGHVNARHSARRISQQQLVQAGLGLGVMLAPRLADFAGIASAGLSVLFLKFSRDDERQADALGFRYMTEIGYDPRGMVDVFEMLGRLSEIHGGSGIPNWLSTHPDPGDRQERIDAMIAESGRDYSNAIERQREYVRRLDGMVYGENPRDGFFRDALFLHPDLRFQFAFPAGWTVANQPQAVLGQSPNEDAMVQLSMSDAADPVAAANVFVAQQGVSGGPVQSGTIHNLSAASADFSAQTEQSSLRGRVTFVEYDGRVYQLLGLSTQDAWAGYQAAVRQSLESFDRLTDPTALNVQPLRIRIVTLDRAMTLNQFAERYPSSVPMETLALLNQAEPYTAFTAGSLVKRLVGTPVP